MNSVEGEIEELRASIRIANELMTIAQWEEHQRLLRAWQAKQAGDRRKAPAQGAGPTRADARSG